MYLELLQNEHNAKYCSHLRITLFNGEVFEPQLADVFYKELGDIGQGFLELVAPSGRNI